MHRRRRRLLPCLAPLGPTDSQHRKPFVCSMLLIVRQKRLTIYYENSFWRLLDNLFATSVDIYWFFAHIYPFRALCMWVFLLLFFALVSGLSYFAVSRHRSWISSAHLSIVPLSRRAHGMLAGLIEIFNLLILFRLWEPLNGYNCANISRTRVNIVVDLYGIYTIQAWRETTCHQLMYAIHQKNKIVESNQANEISRNLLSHSQSFHATTTTVTTTSEIEHSRTLSLLKEIMKLIPVTNGILLSTMINFLNATAQQHRVKFFFFLLNSTYRSIFHSIDKSSAGSNI